MLDAAMNLGQNLFNSLINRYSEFLSIQMLFSFLWERRSEPR